MPVRPLPASSPEGDFAVQASEVVVQPGVPLGKYRRIVYPFRNWTLICDEDRQRDRKVCNVSQIIVDRSGRQAFSWSLAATEDGKPYMIVRTPAHEGQANRVAIELQDGKAEVIVPLKQCDRALRLGHQFVGPRLRASIEKKTSVRISYDVRTADGSIRSVAFTAPLDGLSETLGAI